MQHTKLSNKIWQTVLMLNILSHYKDDSYKTMIDHFDVEQYNVINVEF